jgi:hypothetical protein
MNITSNKSQKYKGDCGFFPFTFHTVNLMSYDISCFWFYSPLVIELRFGGWRRRSGEGLEEGSGGADSRRRPWWLMLHCYVLNRLPVWVRGFLNDLVTESYLFLYMPLDGMFISGMRT